MYTIEELEKKLGIRAYLIQYLESNFPSIRQVKGENSENLYSEDDFIILKKLRDWIINEGMSVEEARELLDRGTAEENVEDTKVTENESEIPVEESAEEIEIDKEAELRELYDELGELIKMMKRLI